MADKSEKKSLLSRIGDALYEKVEADEDEARAEPRQAAGTGAAPAAESAAEPPLESPADLEARLRGQIAARGPAFAQFLALVASFAEIVPQEADRYRVAMKALEKTGSVTRDQLLLAGKDQLLALQTQREAFADVVERHRGRLRQGGGAVDAVRGEIAELRRRLAALEEREQALLREAAAEESRLQAAETKVTGLLASLETEITAAREKIKSYLPE